MKNITRRFFIIRSIQSNIILIAFFFATLLNTSAQTWSWAGAFSGIGNSHLSQLASGGNGSIYTTGTYYFSVDFDPGPADFWMTSNGQRDIFITKSDSLGNFIWGRTIGEVLYENHSALALDEFDNVYITGEFFGMVDFDPGPDTFFLGPDGSTNMFLLKLDSAGNFIWAKCLHPYQNNSVRARSIAVDAGFVYVTGGFGGLVDFNPDTGTFDLFGWVVGSAFVTKFDTAGNFNWAQGLQGYGGSDGNSIAVDQNGYMYVTGSFKDSVDFDPGPNVYWMAADSSYHMPDVFILKLDPSGNFYWTKRFGGHEDDQASDIILDPSGRIYFTGTFRGTADFDPGAGNYFLNADSLGRLDAFISCLDSGGNFVWAKKIGGTGFDGGSALAMDQQNNLYLTGGFSGQVDFDPDSIDIFYLTADTPYSDVFVTKLDPNGDFVWANSTGGFDSEYGSDIGIGNGEKIIVGGDFDSDSMSLGVHLLMNAETNGSSDNFIAFIEPPLNTSTFLFTNSNEGFIVYPNPTYGEINLVFETRIDGDIEIFNSLGIKVYSDELHSDQNPIMDIDFSNQHAGIYFVVIHHSSGIAMQKLIVN